MSTLEALSRFPLAGGAVHAQSLSHFLAAYGQIFEHSAWVLERAWPLRPFADAEALHAAFRRVLGELDEDERLRLIRAHPELADRVAIADGLTASSTAEQASAGLDQLTSAEFERFQVLNGQYRKRHGFPFIICARLHGKDEILSIMQQRVTRATDRELQEAVEQINLICRLQLWTQMSD